MTFSNSKNDRSCSSNTDRIEVAFAAIKDGNTHALRDFLRQFRDPCDIKKDFAGELLHAAVQAEQSNIAMCEILLNFGLPKDTADRDGNTALMLAVIGRSWVKNTKQIFDRFASVVDVENNAGQTPLMAAAQGGSGFGAQKGNAAVVRQLLSLGACTLACDKSGLTALGHAEIHNKTGQNKAVVKLLKAAMINEAARAEFDRRFHFAFDKFGVLQTTPRK